MENATKALLITAGVLIGVLILSFGTYLYYSLSSYLDENQIQIERNELNKFNVKFTKYVNYSGNDKQFDLSIHDVVTAANIAYENNRYYNLDSSNAGNTNTLYVEVKVQLDGGKIKLEEELKNKSVEDIINKNVDTKFKCTNENIKYSTVTGRVYSITFEKEN